MVEVVVEETRKVESLVASPSLAEEEEDGCCWLRIVVVWMVNTMVLVNQYRQEKKFPSYDYDKQNDVHHVWVRQSPSWLFSLPLS